MPAISRRGFGAIQPGVLFGEDAFSSVVLAARARFSADIDAIVGAGNLRLLFIPAAADTVTSTDLSSNARVITQGVSAAGRLTAVGFGNYETWDGSTHYATVPDTTNMSFGNGTTDSPFTIISLANVTDTANTRELMTKFVAVTGCEYIFRVTTTDQLLLELSSDAAGTHLPFRTSDSAITQGSTHLFAATYSGLGGALAANGITLYQDSAVIASTATNDAAYVAMNDFTAAPNIGSRGTGAANPMQGTIGMTLVCATALSLAQMGLVKTAVNNFFGLSL